jgi:hypothetical protein
MPKPQSSRAPTAQSGDHSSPEMCGIVSPRGPVFLGNIGGVPDSAAEDHRRNSAASAPQARPLLRRSPVRWPCSGPAEAQGMGIHRRVDGAQPATPRRKTRAWWRGHESRRSRGGCIPEAGVASGNASRVRARGGGSLDDQEAAGIGAPHVHSHSRITAILDAASIPAGGVSPAGGERTNWAATCDSQQSPTNLADRRGDASSLPQVRPLPRSPQFTNRRDRPRAGVRTTRPSRRLRRAGSTRLRGGSRRWTTSSPTPPAPGQPARESHLPRH